MICVMRYASKIENELGWKAVENFETGILKQLIGTWRMNGGGNH